MSIITDIRDDLKVYDHKTNLISEIRLSSMKQYLYFAVIHDLNKNCLFIIPFGNRYNQFYYDSTPLRGSYDKMENSTEVIREKWLSAHGKWTSKVISQKYLEYLYLFRSKSF